MAGWKERISSDWPAGQSNADISVSVPNKY